MLKFDQTVPVSDFLPSSVCSVQLLLTSKMDHLHILYGAEWRAASGMLLKHTAVYQVESQALS